MISHHDQVDARGEMPLSIRNLVVKQARLVDSGVYTCKAAVFITDRLYYETKSVNISVGEFGWAKMGGYLYLAH